MLGDGGGTICGVERDARSRIAAGKTSSQASGRSHSMDAPTRPLAQYHRTLNPARPCQSWLLTGDLVETMWYVLSHPSQMAITMVRVEEETAVLSRKLAPSPSPCFNACLHLHTRAIDPPFRVAPPPATSACTQFDSCTPGRTQHPSTGDRLLG